MCYTNKFDLTQHSTQFTWSLWHIIDTHTYAQAFIHSSHAHPTITMWLFAFVIIINYSDFPSHILAAGNMVAVCSFVVCFCPYMFLQLLLTILCMAAVCFLFSPQMQQLVTWFLDIGVYLFKHSPFLSLHSPSFFNLSCKKKNNGAANYDYY